MALECVGYRDPVTSASCLGTGQRRRVTRNILCVNCRQHPKHRLITRTTAKNAPYNLPFSLLHAAWLEGKIQMFTVRNPYYQEGKKSLAPMRLYFEVEISKLSRAFHHYDDSASSTVTLLDE